MDRFMQAARYYGIGDIRIEEVARPRAGPGEALLKVGAAGICATDLRIYTNGQPRIPPGSVRILGHELAGEIVEVGKGVTWLEVGMRVGVAPNIGCGLCEQCVAGWTNLCASGQALGISLDGGFAQYMLIPAAAIRLGNVVPIPDHLTYSLAALAEPLSSCLNGQEAVGVGVNDVVLIIGAGPIGAMHVVLAKLAGAGTVISSGWPESRLEVARSLGADITLTERGEALKAAMMEATDGQGAHVVIVAAGSPQAQEEALGMVRRQGRINFFAGLPGEKPLIQFNSNLVHYRQLLVTGTTGSNIRQYRAATDLLATGRIQVAPLVSALLPLNRFLEGMGRSRAKKEMRILVEPPL